MRDQRRLRWSRVRRLTAACTVTLLLGSLANVASADPAPDRPASHPAAKAVLFDFDHGNAALEVVYPALQAQERSVISKDGSDITLIVDYGMLLETSWFDSIAPYHRTAVGIHSNLGRRPVSERTNRNKNTAILYTSYRIFNARIPQAAAAWREMMTAVGLDPDDRQENTRTAARHRQPGGPARPGGPLARRYEPLRRRGRTAAGAVRGLHRVRAGQHGVRTPRPLALAMRPSSRTTTAPSRSRSSSPRRCASPPRTRTRIRRGSTSPAGQQQPPQPARLQTAGR